MKHFNHVWSGAGALFAAAVVLSSWGASEVLGEVSPKYYAVGVSASVEASPPRITLHWDADPNAERYTVHRKAPGAGSWGDGSTLSGDATSFVDAKVSPGTAYEYQVSKATRPGYAGFGYVCAGIDAPLIEDRGKVVLLVDSLYAGELANELTRLQKDLVGDGWTVIRHDVSRTDSPENIKSTIVREYAADPANVRAVFLFGHVPTAYSGNLNPDGHPDHQGAWPTDAYYGDMDGVWTDNSVNNTSAQRQANWNVPGDGKFDQNELPSDVELQVGRVDLANLTCFSNKDPARYEKDLLRQYLNKDYNFRHGLMAVQRRGLICDNFGEKSGEAFAASGWRNFSAFFGAENVTSVPGWNYFSTLASQSYLWSYGCGGGSYYTCDGIGSSDDFATTDIKSVFTLLLGSYFGDWDNESNFLRAPLGSTSFTLAVAWAGRPHWFLHHMGLGETLGYGARISQNNRNGGLYSAQNYATHNVHVALLGDPTLRMHPVLAPSSLNGTISGAGVSLNWTASPDKDLLGYHVYRSSVANGPFTRVTGSAPITQTAFTDPTVIANTHTYMVRAIKRERSGGGTYLNPSQGVFFGPDSATSWGGAGAGSTSTLPTAPSGLTASAESASHVTLRWTDTTRDEAGFKVERKDAVNGSYALIATLGPNVTIFGDDGLAAGTRYMYRVFAFNNDGASPYSSEAAATTSSAPSVPASAVFVAADTFTQGIWSAGYGAEGFDILAAASNYPAYAKVSPRGATDWTWAWVTSDPRGLQVDSGPARVAAAWHSTSSFDIDLDLLDGQAHRVTLYCVDWDTAARRQTIEVLDASTGKILNSQSISDFHGGRYLSWNLTGRIVIRVTRNGGHNAVVSGIFFDPPSSAAITAAQPAILPDGGEFAEPTPVTLETSTQGAVIRYTLDGTEPTAASLEYQGPITLSASATVKAKAFKAGMAESATASALFRLNAISLARAQALFIRTDATTQGSWKGVYGAEGFHILGDPSGPARYPDYVAVGSVGAENFVWNDATSDIRALQQANKTVRVAGCLYSETGFSLDLDFIDGRTHRLAVYCLDWDKTGRAQIVDILDAETGAMVTSQTVPSFTGGKYLVWDIKGHVQVRFTKLGGNNAVLMGVFFSPASIQLGNEDSGSLNIDSPAVVSGADLKVRITGQVGERFMIQSSTDLVRWERLTEFTLPSRSVEFTDPQANGVPMRFYRALPVAVE